MNILHSWQLLLVTLAGGINRQQHDVIAYIQEENRVAFVPANDGLCHQ